jgi:hypothetical protein
MLIHCLYLVLLTRKKYPHLRTGTGRAMTQAVSRRPLAAEVRVRSWMSLCGICGGQSGTGTGFSPSTSVFPLSISFHRCSIIRKNIKKHLILIFITGLHNKPEGCGASVASAAGPFTTQKSLLLVYIHTYIHTARMHTHTHNTSRCLIVCVSYVVLTKLT